MKAQLLQLALAFLVSLVFNATAATCYVDLNSRSPTALHQLGHGGNEHSARD